MKKKCLWSDPAYRSHGPLPGDTTANVLIVGAGVAGLFVAYFLLEQGVKNIVILESGEVGSGSTGHSAGMLVGEIETASWRRFAKKHGAHGAAQYFAAQVKAQRTVAALIAKARIRCDFAKEDFLFVTTSNHRSEVRADLALRHRIGSPAKVLEGAAFTKEFAGVPFTLGEMLEHAISVNPLAFAHGVAAHLRKNGVRIFENTPLMSVRGQKAQTPQGAVTHQHIVYAVGTHHTSPAIQNFVTTIGVTRPLTTSELRALRLSDKDMFLDQQIRSYHYGKITRDNRLLMGFGDLAHQGQYTGMLHVPHLENIKRFIRTLSGRALPLEYAWSASYALSKKTLPVVKTYARASHIAGAGTQIASIVAAEYLAHTLSGKKHSLDTLFS